jgi:hypothetical protein
MKIHQLQRMALLCALAFASACGGGDAEAGGGTGKADSAAAPGADSAKTAAAAPAVKSPRDQAPAIIRGLYLNAYKAGSGTQRKRFIEIADQTEINAFVIDVKDERGVHYPSQIELAMQLSQPAEITLRNLKAIADTLEAHGIWTIARIVVFKDPVLSKAKPEWSVQRPGGGLWVDKAGNTWVSTWDERVWDYNIQIAEEVAKLGFDEIQFDYIRFAEPYKSLPPQVHPRARGDRTDAIAAFLNEAKRRLHPLGVTVTADVFGLSPNEAGDVNIGQQWETVSAIADGVLPMMYPSHYFPTHLPGVRRPDLQPYDVLFKSAGMARWRSDQMQAVGVRPARIVPWLQAFSAPWLGRNHQKYGPEQIRQQKQGTYDVGLDDWILWHPGSNYEQFVPALERGEAQSRKKASYTPPADVMSWLNRFEREGVRAAREEAARQARGDVTDPAAAAAARTGRPDPSTPPSKTTPGTNAPAEAAPKGPASTPAAGGQTNPSNPAQNRP